MTVEITISESALESMVLAACEAYEFGKNNKLKAVETYAHLWGHRRKDNGTEYIQVDRVNICVSAKVSSTSVELLRNVVALQDDIVKQWSPHLSLLGDFHTHPFETLRDLKDNKGFEFSSTDKKSFIKDDNLWELSDGAPISLVLAIAKLRKVKEGWSWQINSHRWRFSVGQYRIYINAAIGNYNKEGKREFTYRGINLDLRRYLYNEPRKKVGKN